MNTISANIQFTTQFQNRKYDKVCLGVDANYEFSVKSIATLT